MPTRICRWVTDHPIAFALIFFVFYLIGFFTLEQLITEPVYLIHCTLDDWIPFNEWFIFAYGSWFFLIPWALITLLRRDRSNYFYLCAVMFSGMAICLLLCLLLAGCGPQEKNTADSGKVLYTVTDATSTKLSFSESRSAL